MCLNWVTRRSGYEFEFFPRRNRYRGWTIKFTEPELFSSQIGNDTFGLLDPLAEQGVMPFTGRVLKEGVRADLMSNSSSVDATGLDVDDYWAQSRSARYL